MSQFHRNGRMVGLALVMWQVHVTLFASWGNRFEAQRRPAERRAADQGMPMTETRLDVLFLNSLLHPPANNRYLAEVNQFYVSRIHTFGGNCWQLRTLRSSSGTRRIVPIIVNTGGSAYNMPIFNERVRSFFLPDYNKRKGMKGDWRGRRTTDAVQFPTPLGDGISIASGEWDTERAEDCSTKHSFLVTPSHLLFEQVCEVLPVPCVGRRFTHTRRASSTTWSGTSWQRSSMSVTAWPPQRSG